MMRLAAAVLGASLLLGPGLAMAASNPTANTGDAQIWQILREANNNTQMKNQQRYGHKNTNGGPTQAYSSNATRNPNVDID